MPISASEKHKRMLNIVSQSGKIVSDEARADPEQDSVYDFFYHDARRVGSFLAQLDSSGHLTGLKQTEATESGSVGKVGGGVGASAYFLKGNATLDDQSSLGEKQSLERSYDPLWTNALTLLDALSERGMIQRNLIEARIGQFVLVTGNLLVLDLSMIKSAWNNPIISGIIRMGATDLQTSAVAKGQRRPDRPRPGAVAAPVPSEPVDIALALMSMLPHSLQCRLVSDTANVWCSIDEEFVVGRASDVLLKHGALLQGEWSILGIMDAYPDDGDVGNAANQEILSRVAGTIVGQLVVGLSGPTRQLLGRPPETYGVTPLLIFREVAG